MVIEVIGGYQTVRSGWLLWLLVVISSCAWFSMVEWFCMVIHRSVVICVFISGYAWSSVVVKLYQMFSINLLHDCDTYHNYTTAHLMKSSVPHYEIIFLLKVLHG